MLGWLSLKNCRNSKVVLQNSLPTVRLMWPLYQLFVRFNGPLSGNLLILSLNKWFSDPLKETRPPVWMTCSRESTIPLLILLGMLKSTSGCQMATMLLKSAGGQKCFSYSGAKLRNSLGTAAKNSSTLRGFKREVQKWSLKFFVVILFFLANFNFCNDYL